MSQVAETNETGQYLSHGIISASADDATVRMAIDVILITIAISLTGFSNSEGVRSLLLLADGVILIVFSSILHYEDDNFSKGFVTIGILVLLFGIGFLPEARFADVVWSSLILLVTSLMSIIGHKNAEKIYGIYKSAIVAIPELLFKAFQLCPILFYIMGAILILLFLFGGTQTLIAGLGIYSLAMGFLLTFIMIAIAGGKDRASMFVSFACTVICVWLGTVTILL
jgi:hypothetical protein